MRPIKLFLVSAICMVVRLCMAQEMHNPADQAVVKKDLFEKAQEVVDHVNTAVEVTKAVVTGVSILSSFSQLASALSALGPVFMAVSAILSIISIFLPREDSPELKALRAGFEKVNTKLDEIGDHLEDLKIVIEISNGKAVIVKSIDSIRVMSDELSSASKRQTKKAWEYFVTKYEGNYHNAAQNLYNAFVTSHDSTDFRFDMLSLYRDKYKCQVNQIGRTCLSVMQLLNEGMAVEASYLGATRYSSRLKLMRVVWRKRMQRLQGRCEEIMAECRVDWQRWAEMEWKSFYNANIGKMQDEDFVSGLMKKMMRAYPFRAWGVFLAPKTPERYYGYDAKSGSSVYFAEKYLDNDKNFAILSMDKEDKSISKDSCKRVGEVLIEYNRWLRNSRECSYHSYGSTNLVAHMIWKFPELAFISIQVSKKPIYKAEHGHFEAYSFFDTYCLYENFRILAFC
ncbi:hypothetical protein Ciccas_011328 [Cichlidogyrus casuarinus]|uniref:Uncharacterized protein n=1 Tax=Cichlidogyrus casuarinus TaxID=1844966 RepID=A0ABD2PRJ7_9PLAT